VKHHHEHHSSLHAGGDVVALAAPAIDVSISPNYAQKIIQFLSSWLSDHVHTMDKDMTSLF
jgi:hemerythrin